jgi:uncharacterized protein YdeI (YjbR/CyaY-like superfamily)
MASAGGSHEHPLPALPRGLKAAARRLEDLEHVFPSSRSEWRAWLAANGSAYQGVWLVYRKGREAPLRYEDAVEEALCFGWIDSTVRGIDVAYYRQLFTRRKDKSVWSKANKQRVARLTAAGAMTPAGLERVETAKRLGTWTLLDGAEALEEPPELREALAAAGDAARRGFAATPPGARKLILQGLVLAKSPETRARRLAESVAQCVARDRKRRRGGDREGEGEAEEDGEDEGGADAKPRASKRAAAPKRARRASKESPKP